MLEINLWKRPGVVSGDLLSVYRPIQGRRLVAALRKVYQSTPWFERHQDTKFTLAGVVRRSFYAFRSGAGCTNLNITLMIKNRTYGTVATHILVSFSPVCVSTLLNLHLLEFEKVENENASPLSLIYVKTPTLMGRPMPTALLPCYLSRSLTATSIRRQ